MNSTKNSRFLPTVVEKESVWSVFTVLYHNSAL